MSWSEEVAFILLNFIHDPEIIRYLLTIAKSIHFKYLFEEAKIFHDSLRLSRLDRWNKTKELSRLRKFNKMNSLVPITCTLPIDNGMWKNSCELLKSIRFMRKGFLRRKYPIGDHAEDIELELPLKIKCINLISEDSITGSEFRGPFGSNNASLYPAIREALDDFEIYQDIDNEIGEVTPYNELPYLLVEVWCNGTCQSGYSKRKYTFKDNTELYITEIMN